MPPTEIPWDIEDHTRIKHRILEKYINAWFPILNRYNNRVVFVDGFCGPGDYKCGAPGSPLIALRAFRDHRATDKMKATFLFLDSRADVIDYLQDLLAKESIPTDRIHYECHRSEFDKHANGLLQRIEQAKNKTLHPSLWFVDPFGWTGIPMELFARISRQPKSELFVNFMATPVQRFLFAEKNRPDDSFLELFGGVDVRERLDKRRSLDDVVTAYQEILLEQTEFEHTLGFALGNVHGNYYHMVYATKSEKGIEKMKDAMWGADPSGSYRFSARATPADQLLLVDLKEPDFLPLQQNLLSQFGGQSPTIEEIERFANLHTIYRKQHLRKEALKPLEYRECVIEVQPPPGRQRKKGTYPAGSRISFKGV